MLEAFVPADFGDAALGREIALQNYKSTGGLQRFIEPYNDFLAASFGGALGLGVDRLPGYGHRLRMEVLASQQLFC
jgi:hypothetical protein